MPRVLVTIRMLFSSHCGGPRRKEPKKMYYQATNLLLKTFFFKLPRKTSWPAHLMCCRLLKSPFVRHKAELQPCHPDNTNTPRIEIKLLQSYSFSKMEQSPTNIMSAKNTQ